MSASQSAFRRLCVAVDVESYSKRSRDEQLDVQNRLLWAMAQGCRVARVNPARCDRQDSGDGQILILPVGVDESAVLHGFVHGLLAALDRVNHPAGPAGRIRLKVAIGQGAVQVGATGFVAPAVVTVCRLRDSGELRSALAARKASDAAFIVTADLYRDLFAEGYGGLQAGDFRAVHVSRPDKGFAEDAWIQVPGALPRLGTVPAYPDASQLKRRQRSGAGLVPDLTAAAGLAWALYAGSKRDSALPGDPAASRHGPGQHVSPGTGQPASYGISQHPLPGDRAAQHGPAHDTQVFSVPGHDTEIASAPDRITPGVYADYYTETGYFITEEVEDHAGGREISWQEREYHDFGFDLTQDAGEHDAAGDDETHDASHYETDAPSADFTDHFGHP